MPLIIVNFTMKPTADAQEGTGGDNVEEKTKGNVIRMSVCPTKISIKTEKKYKEKKMGEIMNVICALLNSNGGKLYLTFDKSPPRRHVRDCVRMIEQRVKEFTTCCTVSTDLTLQLTPPGTLTIILTNSVNLITLNYNLYLPSECQVMSLSSCEPIENIKRILQVRVPTMKLRIDGNWHFVKNYRQENIRESKFVAYKHLKDNPSKCVTLADRILGKSNKFTSYVSAFANHAGGRIYYGIDDDGAVQGENITEEDKDEIIRKVKKTIKKMIWPEYCGEPQKGKHWDLHFQPVVDITGKAIPSTYVIVVHVAECPGGVFTEEPESYRIANSSVEKMNFNDWKCHLLGVSNQIVPHRDVPRITWSSAKNRRIYSELTMRLVQYRNDNMMTKFKELGELAISKYTENNARLVFVSEEVAVALKYHHFSKAENLFKTFGELFENTKIDCGIFAVRNLYLDSRIQRAVGNYADSYKIAKDGIQMMEQIPAEFMTVWFYMHTAQIATILSSTEKDRQTSHDLRRQAKELLRLAARDANMLNEFPQRVSDLQQKLHIYTASIYLGCSLTGKTLDKSLISDLDVKTATLELAMIHQSIFSETPPTRFRQIQFLLTQSDLFYRYSQRTPDQEHQTRNLKRAFEYARKAQRRAWESKFEEMVQYANARCANLTEMLLRNVRGTLRSKKDFDNFEDYIENFAPFAELEV